MFNNVLQTPLPISNKIGTMHPGVKGNQVCEIEGLIFFTREDNIEIMKMHIGLLEFFFLDPLGKFQPNLAL